MAGYASLPRALWLEAAAFNAASDALLAPGVVASTSYNNGNIDDDYYGNAAPFDVGAVPRLSVQYELERHVASLGPPHTLVLTGVEGSGKTTALVTLIARLRELENAEEEEEQQQQRQQQQQQPHVAEATGNDDAVAQQPSPRRSGSGSRGVGASGPRAAPFVLTHSFADPSFSQDVSHFLAGPLLNLH